MDDFRDVFTANGSPYGALTAGGSATGSIETDGDDDAFAITLIAGRTYTFDLKGVPGGGGTLVDTYLELRDGAAGYIAASFDFITTDSRIVYTATSSATYYLSASGQQNTATGTYTLSADAGFVDDYRDVYNDTLEALGAVAPGGSATGNIEIDGDDDVFAITLVAGRTYRFDLRGVPGGGGTLADTYLELRDGAGSYINASFDANGSTNSQIVYTATANGTYHLVASGQQSTGTGTYTLSANAGFIDDYRDVYNDTLEALGSVAAGGSTTGSVEINGDRDVFRIELVAGGTYTFDLKGVPGGGGTLGDAYLELRDAAGSYINASFDSNGTTNAQITYTAATSGFYYLVASGQQSTGTGTYTLSASGGFVDDYRDVFNDTTETLGSLSPGGSRTGSIELDGDDDVFAITLVAGRRYAFDLKGVPGGGGTLADTYLELRDGTGSYVDASFDFNGTTNSRIVFDAIVGGTYYLTASGQQATGTGTYTILSSAGTAIPDDYGDTIADTTPVPGALAINASRNGRVEIAGDRDVFSMNLVGGQTYTFDLTSAGGSTGLVNGELRLLDAAGTQLRFNDDFNSAGSSRIVFTAATTGVYYLDARSHVAGGAGAYTVSARTGFDDYRDTRTDATAPLGTLTIGDPRLGNIETAGDVDVFAVSLTVGQTYTFDLAGSVVGGDALANAELRLLSSTGSVLLTNDNFNSANSRIVFTATSTGTFYLDVRSHVATGTGTYTLSARGDFDDYRDSISDMTAPLGAMPINATRLGTIETSGDLDVFSVTLTAGVSYTFDLSGSTAASFALANAELRLLSGTGTLLRSNDDFNSSNARVAFTATSTGTYYLEARSHFAGGTGTYALTARSSFDDFRDTLTDASSPIGSLAVGDADLGIIEIGGDRDFFSMTLVVGRTYTFDLISSAITGDRLSNGELRLYDSTGLLLRFNDDFNSINSRIVFTATSTATYYLEARGHLSTDDGTYLIGFKNGFDDYRDTLADTTSALGSLTVGAQILATIETVSDRDIFAVTLIAGQSYTFDLSGSTLAGDTLLNAELRLLGSTGTLLRFNDDFNGASSRIVFTATSTATYYLEIRSHAAGDSGTYLLSAKAGFDDYADAITDPTAALVPLPLASPRLGTIETPGDTDVFRVSMLAGHTYAIDLKMIAGAGGLIDGDLQLANANGTILAYNDDFNGTPNAQIVFTAATNGTYYVNARGVGAKAGTYEIGLRDVSAGGRSEQAARTDEDFGFRSDLFGAGGDSDYAAHRTHVFGQPIASDWSGTIDYLA